MDISLKIEGIHCSGCARAIKNALAETQGVRSVDVDVEAGRAKISADDGTPAALLIAAVADAGYDATVGA